MHEAGQNAQMRKSFVLNELRVTDRSVATKLSSQLFGTRPNFGVKV